VRGADDFQPDGRRGKWQRPLAALIAVIHTSMKPDEIVATKGEYKDQAAVILRSIDLQKFPLKWAALLGLESECIFFRNYDREKSSGESTK
jgi:hypothetical protein